MVEDKIEKVLISEEEIKDIVLKLADRLNVEYQEKEVILVLVLKGSIVFCADLMRNLKFPVILEVMKVSSYGSGTVSNGVKIDYDLKRDIKGKHVLIIEDIIDTGNTLLNLKNMLLKREPESLKICTFVDKPDRRKVDIEADFCGRVIPDEFVVGYGLDFDERYRELPYVGVLKSYE